MRLYKLIGDSTDYFTLLELAQTDNFVPVELDQIADLPVGERRVFGGGAAAEFTVERVLDLEPNKKCAMCRRLADALATLLDICRGLPDSSDGTLETAEFMSATDNAAAILDSYTTEVPHDH